MTRRTPKGQINKKKNDTIKTLQNLMKDLNKKVSIRVGIIGDKAREKHPDSDITNAQLGAIHEFGADIQVTDKMRGFFWHKYGIHLTKKTIHIPARSFLRETLLTPEGKKRLLNLVGLSGERELDKEAVKYKTMVNGNFFMSLCERIGAIAMAMVRGGEDQETGQVIIGAFESTGFGKWKPITEFTKEHRKYDKDSPPLTDSRSLRDSITYQIKEQK